MGQSRQGPPWVKAARRALRAPGGGGYKGTSVPDAPTPTEPEPAAGAADPRAAREVLLAFLAVAGGTWIVTGVAHAPPLDAYAHLAVGVLFLFAAIELGSRAPGGLRRHGLALGGLFDPADPVPDGVRGSVTDLARAVRQATRPALREAAFALLVAAVIFPPFVAGFYLWNAPTRPFTWVLPDAPASYLLTQLVVTALPEEAFFRGYAQSRLGDAFTRRVTLLGASLSPAAWLTQAALFAAIHVVGEFDPRRLAVFFPALLFGWLRARRGGVGAAVAMHALSNVLSDLLTRGWL